MRNDGQSTSFFINESSRFILVLHLLLAGVYFFLVTFWFPRGNTILFGLFLIGEIFHVWQVSTFVHTIWDTERVFKGDSTFTPPVDVLITVAGEPVSIVEKTVRAIKQMRYPNFRVFILNDGFVAKKKNWQEIESLASREGVFCITRQTPGGAKAGNINNALRQIISPFFAVFDADHVPHPDFLKRTVPYFSKDEVGFVQTPQYYENHDLNYVTGGAWEQQKLFFGPICKGKNRFGIVTMCGTNMVIRRRAILEVGGMCDTNIAEDFVTGLFIHKKGWESVYVSEILAKGLAPQDFSSYVKQQHRWARGSLEVIFNFNPIFSRELTVSQKIQYLSSASYYLSGFVVALNALFPLMFLFWGISPLKISSMLLAGVFLPYIFITMYSLQLSSNFNYSFRALAFSMSSFFIHMRALVEVVINRKNSFSVTPKRMVRNDLDKNTLLVLPHILYIALIPIGLVAAVIREGFDPSVITNLAWIFFNVVTFIPFIIAASPRGSVSQENFLFDQRSLKEQAVLKA